jgi:8-oxo-dGTP diphosphatase
MLAALPSIICSVDVALLTLMDGRLHVALLRRDHAPFKGQFALPGAYIATSDKDARAAARRMLQVKTGLVSPYLEELASFTGATRDPRGWSISVAHYALVPANLVGGVQRDVELRDVDDPRVLPFDHSDIVDAAVARLRTKSMYSSLPCYLAGDTFTLPQLRGIYEQVIGDSIDKITFRRKIMDMDVLEAVEGAKQEGAAHRPGQLYRLKPALAGDLSLLSRGMR